jgi:hypothetical protein
MTGFNGDHHDLAEVPAAQSRGRKAALSQGPTAPTRARLPRSQRERHKLIGVGGGKSPNTEDHAPIVRVTARLAATGP